VVGAYDDGTWRYDPTTGWNHISNLQPLNLDVDDAGNVYAQYLAGNPSDGLWRWSASTASWAKLSDLNVQQLKVTAGGVLYGDFGNQGLWRWSNSGWMLLSNLDPQGIAVSDSDAFFGAFTTGSVGTWRWTPTAGWSLLTSSTSPFIQADSAGDFVGLFIASGQQGTWRWSPTTGWARLSIAVPSVSMVVSANGTIYENRGASGIWYAPPGATSFYQIDATSNTGAILTPLPDGSLYVHRSDGTHYYGWHWSPARPAYGFVKLLVTDNLSLSPAVGKDGDLFFRDYTSGAQGTGYWSLTSFYHLLGGPGSVSTGLKSQS
jgi:hypothetical protein